MPMLRAFLTAYPWDLIDEGVATVLDQLHGEIGVTGLSVWIGVPPIVQLRVREVRPRVYRTRGGVFFHPDEQHYTGSRCKPVVSTWIRGRQPLKHIAEACAERAMELRVIVSAAITGRLSQRYPEMASKNLFGIESHAGVCLANPDFQAYLSGLVSDLSGRDNIAGVTLSDFEIAWPEAFQDDLRGAKPLGQTERSLFATCFCESCHQHATAAGVDVGMARRSVQVILQKILDAGLATDWTLDAVLSDDAPLAEYYHWRTEELSSLLSRLVNSCKCEVLLDRPFAEADRQHTDPDLSLPAAVITRLDHPDRLGSALSSAARRNELRLPESLAIAAHGPELVGTLSRAVELGVTGVEIDNYGLLPDAALTPIKQAIRFARRTTSE